MVAKLVQVTPVRNWQFIFIAAASRQERTSDFEVSQDDINRELPDEPPPGCSGACPANSWRVCPQGLPQLGHCTVAVARKPPWSPAQAGASWSSRKCTSDTNGILLLRAPLQMSELFSGAVKRRRVGLRERRAPRTALMTTKAGFRGQKQGSTPDRILYHINVPE